MPAVTAVSMNVGGGVPLIKLAKLQYMCKIVHGHAKTLQTQQGQTHGARSLCHTAEPLGERRYENWIATITNLSISLDT